MEALRIIVYIVVAVLAIAAVKTALPNQTASKPCLLGYRAACSFTPVSTLILVAAAVALFVAINRGGVGQ
ncbi:MAG: hypothetical protein NWE93_08240 [Candidatus Bathyarchaeota archaeon]|nr:hypothetical protein [Candidatus Bathyarchaeota archaeon]